MEPLEAMMAVTPLAKQVMDLLVLFAAPKLHGALRAGLPKDGTVTSLRDLFRRFGDAAAAFEANQGMFDGADRFVRAARTLGKFWGHTSGWDPRVDAPPQAIVDLARQALRHLGVQAPDGGWDDYAGPPPGDASV